MQRPIGVSQTQESRFEAATIVLLGLAALITAWAAFQASLWDGVSLDQYAFADVLQGDALALRDAALNLSLEDETAFLEYAKAFRTGDGPLATLIKREFMSKRVRDAVDSWEKAPIAGRESSPLSESYGYSVPGREQSTNLSATARATMHRAREANSTGDKYNLAAILLAASLFLVGISSTLKLPRFRAGLLAIGTLILVGTVAWLATLDIREPFS